MGRDKIVVSSRGKAGMDSLPKSRHGRFVHSCRLWEITLKALKADLTANDPSYILYYQRKKEATTFCMKEIKK